MTDDIPLTVKDISGKESNWCAGCGDFGILAAFRNVVVKLHNEDGVPLENFVAVGGIGCSAKTPEWLAKAGNVENLGLYGCHTLHGRDLSVASALKMANPNCIVVAFGGDGNTLAIGMAEFMHTCRRNHSVTIIIFNNQVYGLTKGQASPTAHKDLVTGSTPRGVRDQPVDPIQLAIVAGATFVARGFSKNRKELEELLLAAIRHNGCAVVDVITPCVTYHREEGGKIRDTAIYGWWDEHIAPIKDIWDDAKRRVEKEAAADPDYDVTDKLHALAVAHEAEEKGRWPLGLFYHVTGVPTAEEVVGIAERQPDGTLKIHAPAHANISVAGNLPHYKKLAEALRYKP